MQWSAFSSASRALQKAFLGEGGHRGTVFMIKCYTLRSIRQYSALPDEVGVEVFLLQCK